MTVYGHFSINIFVMIQHGCLATTVFTLDPCNCYKEVGVYCCLEPYILVPWRLRKLDSILFTEIEVEGTQMNIFRVLS